MTIAELGRKPLDATGEGRREAGPQGIECLRNRALGHAAQQQLGRGIQLVVLAASDNVEGDPAKLAVDPVARADEGKPVVEPVGSGGSSRRGYFGRGSTMR